MANENAGSDVIYKVTVVNSQGTPIVAYVGEASRISYVRSMREEYGNARVEVVSRADLPEGVDL